MATRVKQEHFLTTIGFALLWPLKVFLVYFYNCFVDIAKGVRNDWVGRKKYTGWER